MAEILEGTRDWLHAVFVEQFSIWIAIGFAAQIMFSARFLIQWVASERAGRSVVPVAFWFFSIAGGSIMLAYAIHRQDPVFICGQAAGLIIYSRNLYLIFRERKAALAEAG